MEQYKQEFIEFMVDCKVLKFGDFVTKSGRKTPFFINTGFYRTGAQLKKLGEYYAEAINNKYGTDFDILFGPAYKGIPLSVTTAIALNDKYGADIEDVTTAGTSINETLPIIKAQGNVNVTGLVVSVDRMERGQGTKSALTEIEENYGIRTTAIVTMAEVVEHLYNRPYKGEVIIDDTLKAAIDDYYKQYGVN